VLTVEQRLYRTLTFCIHMGATLALNLFGSKNQHKHTALDL